MRALVLAFIILLPAGARAERPTERYAPAQLRVAQELLEHARAAEALGEAGRAGMLAWQARLDAWLASRMSESPHLRAEAAEVAAAGRALAMRLAGRR